jgi:hypothetical protein
MITGVHVAQGVIFALAAGLTVKVTWKRANTGAKMGGILAVLIAIWLGMWLVDPSSAGLMAAWTADGAAQDIAALGHLVKDVAR